MTELKQLIHQRGQIKARLTRFKSYFKAFAEHPDLVQLKLRLAKVAESWQQFEEVQSLIEYEDQSQTQDNEREEFETSYFSLMAEVESFILQNASTTDGGSITSNGQLHPHASIKLPTLTLPTFNGAYDQWMPFHDTFQSVIHTNQSLSGVQKFQYLISALKSDAAQVVQALEISNDNYKIAWELLKQRYENKRWMVQNHIKALFELSTIAKESHIALRQLLDDTLKHMRALKTLKQPVEHWDGMLVYLTTSKFDAVTRREWESTSTDDGYLSMDEVIAFLTRRCQLLEVLHSGKTDTKHQATPLIQSGRSHQRGSHSLASQVVSDKNSCPQCTQNHQIFQCPEFLECSPEQRANKIKNLKLCFNCLKETHRADQCKAGTCRKCSSKHNTLLHFNSRAISATSDQSGQANTSSATIVSTHTITEITGIPQYILLSTALVEVHDTRGVPHICRALLDSGSQSNFLTKACCHRLGLKTSNSSHPIAGISGMSVNATQMATVKIKSRFNAFGATLQCLILPKISGHLPSTTFNPALLEIPEGLRLADPQFNISSEVDLLIGAGLFYDLLCVGQIRRSKHLPILQKTQLGWVISGGIECTGWKSKPDKQHCNLSLNDQMVKFCQFEECAEASTITKDEESSEEAKKVVSKKRKGKVTPQGNKRKMARQENPDSSDDVSFKPYKKTFVANRVSEIQGLTQPQNWNHISSGDNPADHASRGLTPNQLHERTEWWHGPSWLKNSEETWPVADDLIINSTEALERKMTAICMVSIPDFDIFQQWSTLSRLQRIIAMCCRFINNCRVNHAQRCYGPLTAEEIRNVMNRLVMVTQQQSFGEDIHHLKNKGTLHVKSKLSSLHPFLDKLGILRVGGRLHNALISYDRKHQIILPSGHPFTKLILRHEHVKQLHAGPQLLLAAVRTKFWPLSARNAIRQIVRTCVTCFRVKPIGLNQLMGSLPAGRVTPSRPFSNCGLDYCGPFHLRLTRRRGLSTFKAYLAIFVCFATRAVHLELAADLTTTGFLAVLKRFIARRGKCHHIFSDNATNFCGARGELAELEQLFRSEKHQHVVTEFLAEDQITWHCIPARSPHFGGLWEAAVKSAKHHIRRVAGTASLTMDEMQTLIVQVEACMNSRPLTPISDDPSDLECLTPGHFLIGGPLTTILEPDFTTTMQNRLTHWQRVQQLLQHFWARWSLEYLSQVQQRSKWKMETTLKLTPGAMVILKDDNLPPLKWSLGRISEVHPGQDGLVRVVSIQTQKGVVKRAITRICVLPLEKDDSA